MNEKFLNNIVTVKEMEKQGTSWSHVRTRHSRGELVRVAHGVYTPKSFADGLGRFERPLARIVSETKRMKKPVLSHESAALWRGAPLITVPDRVHFSVPGSAGTRKRSVIYHRNRSKECADAEAHLGVLTTSIPQIIADCTATLSVAESLSVANYFLHERLCTEDDARAALLRPRRYLYGRAVEVSQRLNPLCESPLESMLWSLFFDWGLELPEMQVEFYGDYGGAHRVDFLWRVARLILEADGQVKYTGRYGDPSEVIRHERARQRNLERDGWTVIRVEWNDVVSHPNALLDRLLKMGVQRV